MCMLARAYNRLAELQLLECLWLETAQTSLRFDITAYWARSGLLSMTRDAGAPPTWPIAASGDHATAVGLFSAIVTGAYTAPCAAASSEIPAHSTDVRFWG
jgi:hypothetical protein